MNSPKDDPSPTPAAPAVPARVEISGHELRRAMRFATIGWLFGSVWLTVTSGAPLTQFAKALGSTEFQFGLISALPFIASFVSLPASIVIDRTGRRKQIFLMALYGQRLVWFLIAALPVWMVHSLGIEVAPAAMSIFLILLLVMHCGQAIGGPAWVSWMADLVPERVRGTYFSRRRQWGILPAIPAALIVGYILDHSTPATQNPYPIIYICSGLFAFGALVGLMDIAAFQFHVPDIPAAPKANLPLKKMFAAPLRDPQFLWFAGFVATLVFAVSFMGQFVTLYLLQKMNISNTKTQMMLIVAPALAQLMLLKLWGRAADRMGKKPVLVLSALGLVPVGLGWCFITHDAVWLGYILSAAGAGLWAGVEVANMNMVMELAGSPDAEEGESASSKGSSYVAVNSIIINIAGMAGGLTSGLIAKWLVDWSWTPFESIKSFSFYEILFGLSALLRLLAVVVFLPHIHEPESRPTIEALRFMTANFYNNLYNSVLQPARFLTRAAKQQRRRIRVTPGSKPKSPAPAR